MNNTPTESNTDISHTLGLDASPVGTTRLKRRLIWFGLILLMAASVFKWTTHATTVKVGYKTQPVQIGNMTITVSATGNLEPTNQVDVGSEQSGTIKTVEVSYNDQVKKGQVLARLDTTKLEAEMKKSKAAMAIARAVVLQTQATVNETQKVMVQLKKVRELSHNKAISEYDLDAAEASLERARADEAGARAQVLQAQAVLEYNQTDLAKAIIFSPVNGLVLSREVEPGQTVAASLSAPVLFTLAEDLAQMELHVDVDEADVSQVKEGQTAVFTVDAYPNQTFPARILQIRYGAQTTDGVVTYETVLSVDNRGLLLRPGMTATADITVKQIEQAILIPNAALRFTPTQTENSRQKQSGGIGSVISKLMPRQPGRHNDSPKQNVSKGTDDNQQVVWTQEVDRLHPIFVTIGATDGTLTQVTSGDITPQMALVVDTVSGDE